MSNPAREACLYGLGRWRRDGAWSSAAIDAAVKKFDLSRSDTAFASRVILGTIENLSLCDYYINTFSATPTAKLEPRVLDIMRMSVYQLAFMDRVPTSAAVNEAVELCKSSGCGRASGLVNAVLRRLGESRGSLPAVPGAGTAKYLSVRYSHPEWLAEELSSRYGYDFAEEFFKSDNEAAPLYIQANTLKTDGESLAALFESGGIKCALHPWLGDCLEVQNSGHVTALPGYDKGLFYVQDPAARFCVCAAGLRPGMSVLDACAAPGGKSFAAALEMKNSGTVLSRDIHEKKLGLIKSGAKRLGIGIIETQAADAREKSEHTFDAVFADVPCSGLGVIRSKPEIRCRDKAELAGFAAVQSAILNNLAGNVRRGGILMYSTCTIRREENEDIIESFLSEHDFSLDGFEFNGRRTDGMRTFWPHKDGTDGFFVCRMKKD